MLEAGAEHFRPRSKPEPWGRGRIEDAEAEAKFNEAEQNNVLIEYLI